MTQRSGPAPDVIVMLGIDGAGKTTTAAAVAELLPGTPVLVLGNYSGRKTITAMARRFGVPLPVPVADLLETAVRVFNVLRNHLRASRFDGLVIIDRHLHCQLALRKARGIRRRRALEALLRILPQADAVVYFDLPARQAYERIMLRGEDQETLQDLQEFRRAYQELACYPSFRLLAAGGSVESSAAQLLEIVASVRRAGAPLAGQP